MHEERILVVDAEPSIVKLLQDILHNEGWQTYAATDGCQALRILEDNTPDLVILDLRIPGVDGFEVCRRTRLWSQVPIIVLSAKCELLDKTRCFKLGIDDYITKPFSPEELLCRVEAVLHRIRQLGSRTEKPFIINDLKINFTTRQVTLAGNEVKLTPIEYLLLKELVLNQGKVVLFDYLQRQVLGFESKIGTESLYVHIARLRNKLGRGLVRFKHIVNVPKIGYRFQ